MPFIHHTPESLIPRSDSKNPSATCRGITSSGRLCRRAISSTPPLPNSRISSQSSLNQPIPPAAFCWQHKDQATPAQAQASPQGLRNSTLQERTSVDTLVDRLGLLEVVPEKAALKQRTKPAPPRPVGGTHYNEKQEHRPATKRPRKPQKQGGLAIFCCVGAADDDNVPSRPTPISNHKPLNSTPRPSTFQPMAQPPRQSKGSRVSAGSRRDPIIIEPHRPELPHDPSSDTQQLLALIPKAASPQTTSLLLAELSKPVSAGDDEGYIYIFWLTPESLSEAPPSDVASSLLEVPSGPKAGKRRTSETIQDFSSAGDKDSQKTILLKIGRASNVQRRLNEWTRQCGYNVSLIRYYPYQPSSPQSASSTSLGTGSTTQIKVPHAHKVERLVHIELNGQRIQDSGKCKSCGREHREWFEVEATREGVKRVDEVVRRWVDWSVAGNAQAA